MPRKPRTDVATLDLTAGEKALTRLEPTLRAMKRAELVPLTIDAQEAALAALALVDVAREPARFARLSKLPDEIFAVQTIDQLEEAAWASWYTHVRLRTEQAHGSRAKVDAATYEQAGRHLAKMLKLLEYHLGERAEVAAELASIRNGSGYQDRASDLVRAAVLVEQYEAELAHDRRYWDSQSAAQARAYAEAIVGKLRAHLRRNVAEWADLRARACTRMTVLYGEVREAGAFAFRKDGEQRVLFVPLRQVVAPTRARRANGEAQASADEVGQGSDEA